MAYHGYTSQWVVLDPVGVDSDFVWKILGWRSDNHEEGQQSTRDDRSDDIRESDHMPWITNMHMSVWAEYGLSFNRIG